MAREQRKDVDYFPHACSHGRKMHIIESKYGNNGYAVWFKLLEQLGKANNHFLDINDEMNLMFLVSIFKCEKELVISILTDLAKLGAIDEELFENHNIIFCEKFSESVADAYRKRKNKLFTKNDIFSSILHQSSTNPQEIDGSYPQVSAQSPGDIHKEGVNPPEVIPKEKDRIGKEIEKYKKEIDLITETEFIDIWKRARKYYDKKECGFDKLQPFEKQCFNQLLKDGFTKQDFEFAVAGLFFQDTVPAVRVRPDWLLKPENFEKMLDCWKNKTKIFSNKKEIKSEGKFKTGDV